jgi:hypothetical protein
MPAGTARTSLSEPLLYSQDTQAGGVAKLVNDQTIRRPSAEVHPGFSTTPLSGDPSNTITPVNR